MDERLVGWARAVKSRRHGAGLGGPVLWLFTDAERTADPVAVIRRLPAGLCGVVFRHDGVAERGALLRAVWRACRERRIPMVVAGRSAGFAGPGVHARGGRAGGFSRRALVTASAHDGAALVRARRIKAAAVFLSPVFPTLSHPGKAVLGALRWARLARLGGAGQGGPFGTVLALGGVDGRTVRRLPRGCAGVGAIGALSGSAQ